MSHIKYYRGGTLPLEMHKARIVQKIFLKPIDERYAALKEAGNNTFLLKNRDVFLDMLTDSGVNAMSDKQLAAMMSADDSYAGSETFIELEAKVQEIFGKPYFLPAHQGRACENLISQTLIEKGQIIPMNYHFTTTKSHIVVNGGEVEEIFIDEALNLDSDHPFKGNIDINKLQALIDKHGAEKIAFVRMEAGTNLIGGQPFSLQNAREVKALCEQYNILTVLDASLLMDNLYFIKEREAACKNMSIHEITLALSEQSDVIYFSARKLGSARGGGICTGNREVFEKIRELVPLYEGFLTYGGMSVREMAAMTVGLEETMDLEVINQGPQFIAEMSRQLQEVGVPVVTPAGGLGCHINAGRFLDHLPQQEYPAGALAAALYLVSGVRGMERGTMSEQRNPDGSEPLAHMELVRLAMPRRVYTLSHVQYTVDRLAWLYDNRALIGGLKFVEEPKVLRFFFGKLAPISDWQDKLLAKFKADFGDSL